LHESHLTLSDTNSSFCVTNYVALKVILYAFYEWNEAKRQLAIIQFVKRIQNDVEDDVSLDAK